MLLQPLKYLKPPEDHHCGQREPTLFSRRIGVCFYSTKRLAACVAGAQGLPGAAMAMADGVAGREVQGSECGRLLPIHS